MSSTGEAYWKASVHIELDDFELILSIGPQLVSKQSSIGGSLTLPYQTVISI